MNSVQLQAAWQRRCAALVNARVYPGARSTLERQVVMIDEFKDDEAGLLGKVQIVPVVYPLFHIVLSGQDDEGRPICDAGCADGFDKLLHGTVNDVSFTNDQLRLTYDYTPAAPYMQAARAAAEFMISISETEGPVGTSDQRPNTTIGTRQGPSDDRIGVQVERRLGERGFCIKITPHRKPWSEGAGVAALKLVLAGGYEVTSVTDHSGQQIMATAMPRA